MKQKQIWMALVTDKNEVVFSKACPSKQNAEKAIVEYLRKNEEFDMKKFDEACSWICEKELQLDLMVFPMEPENFKEVRAYLPYFRTDLPLSEKGLYRVIYEIDVGASSVIEAAKTAHDIMSDSDSLLPVLDVIDNKGNKVQIDLSKHKGKG